MPFCGAWHTLGSTTPAAAMSSETVTGPRPLSCADAGVTEVSTTDVSGGRSHRPITAVSDQYGPQADEYRGVAPVSRPLPVDAAAAVDRQFVDPRVGVAQVEQHPVAPAEPASLRSPFDGGEVVECGGARPHTRESRDAGDPVARHVSSR